MYLGELQARFLSLLDGGAASAGLFAAGPVEICRALDVHRSTIATGFIRALAIGYPTVEALVGAEFFERMALDYHHLCPEADATLEDYGKCFPCFVANGDQIHRLPYLGDVASLDQAVEQAQRAEDVFERFAIDRAVSLDLPKSLNLLLLAFPATEIRAAIFDNDERALETLDIAPRRRAAAIWRSGRTVTVSPIAPSAAVFLATLKSGGAADAALAAAAAEEPADVLETLKSEVFAAPFACVQPHSAKVDHER
jgi:hypothetical protein